MRRIPVSPIRNALNTVHKLMLDDHWQFLTEADVNFAIHSEIDKELAKYPGDWRCHSEVNWQIKPRRRADIALIHAKDMKRRGLSWTCTSPGTTIELKYSRGGRHGAIVDSIRRDISKCNQIRKSNRGEHFWVVCFHVGNEPLHSDEVKKLIKLTKSVRVFYAYCPCP